ncbi:uncharacterized protein LOC128721962 [Anopheles nili]|uniref:uncharacterized protein LOC128721962 n=1 Tax=Anopheles nili TaxID=185578 RepID=UPI00237B95E0|nr:uncharacterized protein LOC128721962 [Anopheles nili]
MEPGAADGPKLSEPSITESKPNPKPAQDQQQAKHRHRRDDGYVAAEASDDGGEENFIALAPDEADIYNFSNIMSMTMANGPAGGTGRRGANVNEANPFNEFRNTQRQRPEPEDLAPEPNEPPKGEKELPELTLDDGRVLGEGATRLRTRFDAVPDEDDDGGNGGEVDGESEDDNAIERSRFLAQGSRPAGGQDDTLLSNGIDFLNSIDGAYLLANAGGRGVGEQVDGKMAKNDDSERKDYEDNDNSVSTRKPTPSATDGEDELFEQMEKKAKSYRLKLYKKHKNFKHTHHHRGGLYHQPYHTFHHDYYRRKMLERERERWKKMQDLKPDYQGQINYYENSNKLETNDDIMAHLNGHSSQEKWPNFDKVMTSLKTEPKPDNVPPYIKKYNRRNKQLIDLLEGTIAPLSEYGAHKHRERKYHRRKNPHWMEEDLFEEQRPTQAKATGLQRNYIQETLQSSTGHSNALPGEGIHIIYDKKHADDLRDELGEPAGLLYGRPTMAAAAPDGGHPAYKLSSRAGQFVYHRVASPQPVGPGYGRLKRQRLPFVAITDRRLSAPPKRRASGTGGVGVGGGGGGGGGGSSSNLLNHQPMP